MEYNYRNDHKKTFFQIENEFENFAKEKDTEK